MFYTRSAIFVAFSALFSLTALSEGWHQFRGPGGDGIVSGQSIPTEFGENKGVLWKTELPGRGWSSPVIEDGVIWVTTAIEVAPTDEERKELLLASGVEEKKFKQSAIAKSIELKLLSVDFQSGKLLKTIELASIDKPDAIHTLNSYASPTPVIDGPNLYCHFGTFGTFCIERSSGSVLWKQRFPLQHGVGPGSSPFIHGNLLVLIQDGMDRQYVMALDKSSGKTVWERDRPEMDAPSGDMKKAYCTPILVVGKDGKEQLICMGSQWMMSYEPATGNEIWRCRHGKGFSVVPRPVYADGVVYFATGFGQSELWAVRTDGSGDVTDTHVVWTAKQGIPTKPSPIIHDGLIYVIADNGVASCFETADGTLVWKKRLGGDYSSSPILVGDNLYFGSHEGKVSVVKLGREPEVIAENEVDGKIMASPAVVDNTLLLRTATAIYRIR